MTTKRDKKDEPKAAKRPKLKKETVKDLQPGDRSDAIKGGAAAGGTRRETYCYCT